MMSDSFGGPDEYRGEYTDHHPPPHHHSHPSHHHGHQMDEEEEEDDDDQGVDVAEALRNMGGTSGATGDAGLLYLANEVQMEDNNHHIMGGSSSSGGAVLAQQQLPPPQSIQGAGGEGEVEQTEEVQDLNHQPNQGEVPDTATTTTTAAATTTEIIGMMDVISLDCQRFLIDINCTKASDFIYMDVNELTEKYIQWRIGRDNNNNNGSDSQISNSSARIYLNKWRKRLRDEIETKRNEGIKIEEVGVLYDYTVANPERIAKAQKEKEKRENSKRNSSGGSGATAPMSPTKYTDIKFVNLSLTEPGTFGLKVENTLSNGVRISDVVQGLQGHKAGFEKGDIVSAATMDPDNFEYSTEYNGKDMAFDDFVKVAQSEKRPILVRVRRGGPTDEIMDKNKGGSGSSSGKKRGRPPSVDGNGERIKPQKKKGRKRVKASPHALHKMEVKRVRTMREEIIRAHNLRLAADAVEKSVTTTTSLIGFPTAKQKISDVAQTMREEAYELWDNPNHGEWEGHLKDLLVFKQQSGHFNVPKTHPDKELLKFITVIRATRRSYNKGEYKKTKRKDLAKVEIDTLDKIGFSWKTSPKQKSWDDLFQELASYKELHGTCVIPKQKKGAAYRNLYLWVNQQRKKYDNKGLTDTEIQRLSDLGMVWNLKAQKSWDDHLEDLLEYKLKNGNCKVPAVYKPNRPLGKWVDKMRQEKKKRDAGETSTVLTDERIKMLDYFGFSWEEPPPARASTPRKRYVDMDSDDDEEDDDDDDEDDDEEYNERKERRSMSSSGGGGGGGVKPVKQRKSRGSVGRPSLGKSWEEYYNELVEYQSEYGHTKVPQNYTPNRALGSWVNRMRQQRKKDGVMPGDILTQERIDKLDSIGFVWIARGPGRPSKTPGGSSSSSRHQRAAAAAASPYTYDVDDDDLIDMDDDDDGFDNVVTKWPKRNVVLKHDLFAKVSGKEFNNFGQQDVGPRGGGDKSRVGEGVKEEGPMEVDISDKLAGKKSSTPLKSLLSDVYHGRYKMNEAKEGEPKDDNDNEEETKDKPPSTSTGTEIDAFKAAVQIDAAPSEDAADEQQQGPSGGTNEDAEKVEEATEAEVGENTKSDEVVAEGLKVEEKEALDEDMKDNDDMGKEEKVEATVNEEEKSSTEVVTEAETNQGEEEIDTSKDEAEVEAPSSGLETKSPDKVEETTVDDDVVAKPPVVGEEVETAPAEEVDTTEEVTEPAVADGEEAKSMESKEDEEKVNDGGDDVEMTEVVEGETFYETTEGDQEPTTMGDR